VRADAGPARHDLVWLAPGWTGALASPLAPAVRAPLEGWFGVGRPAVASRPARPAPGAIALGVALPPGGPERRVALVVRAAAVERFAPPLTLAEALDSAPGSWRGPLAALDRAASAAGLTARVHGSLAWQHVSGARYLTPASDVDLLLAVATARDLGVALRLLAERAAGIAPRLDGELLLPGGRGVAWRELAARPARILVKSLAGVALERTRDALGPLAGGLA
jgi:phosphoribosyl-dephospho-CoA transferase